MGFHLCTKRRLRLYLQQMFESFGEIQKDMDRHGKTWKDMERHGKTQSRSSKLLELGIDVLTVWFLNPPAVYRRA